MRSKRNESGFGGSRRRGQPRSARRPPNLAVPKSERDAIKEIESVLSRWGVDPDKNEEHRSFDEAVKRITADCFNSKLIENWQPLLSPSVLPSDMNEALHLLLKHNLKQVTQDGLKTTKRETCDLINEKYDALMPFPPYSLVRGELKLSWAYKELGLSGDELDPLVRYTYTKRDIKEYMMEQYGQVPGEEYPSHFIRALVLYETISGNYKCLSCDNGGSLFWNSNLRSDFCNLICNGCGSVYTLCCVADSKRAQKLLDKGTHFRGSYAHFHQLKSDMQEAGQVDAKMFLILATRSSESSESLEKNGLPVFAAEIKGAMPNLNADSFAPDHIRIKSNIVFKSLDNGTPWFTLDIPKDIDVLGFSMNVFDGYFDALEDNSYGPKDDEDEEAKTNAVQACDAKSNASSVDGRLRQKTNLDKIIKQIENIKGKNERGVNLEKWELDLLGREEKVLSKLKDLEG